MTDDEKLDEILSHFRVQTRKSNGALCRCPCHSDDKASLSITAGRKGILIKCFAQCRTEDILDAVGLRMQDLFYDDSKPEKSNWRAYVENREHKKIEAEYDYQDFEGRYAFTKLRLTGKKMVYGRLTDGRFIYGLGGKHKKDIQAVYGDAQAIKKAVNDGTTIFIPEGEKDCNTLKKYGYTAFTCGGVNDWSAAYAELVEGANVIVLADNDNPGKDLASRILHDVSKVAKTARIVIPMPDVPKADISDFFEKYSKEEFEELLKKSENDENAAEQRSEVKCINGTFIPIKKGSVEDVKALLTYKEDSKGNLKPSQTVRNWEIVLENDSRFSGKFRFDDFSRQTFICGGVPWEDNCYRVWGNADDSALFSIVQSEYGLTNRNDYFDSVRNVANRKKFNPVREVLDALTWDGQEHIRGLLPSYLGAENSDYNYEVMRLFMIGAVSRIYEPGCKFDYCLILSGKQGIGKSTFLQKLALSDCWFSDSLDSLDGDRAVQSLIGVWIVELAELKSLARTSGGDESVKRFISARQDRLRIPYERRFETFQRSCVFAGTTNRVDFLTDQTGNRRFLVVAVGEYEPTKNLFDDAAQDEIKLAWSEAVHMYKSERPRLILPEYVQAQAEHAQDSSMIDNGLAGVIEEYLSDEKRNRTCVLDIWRNCLKKDGQPKRYESNEIVAIINNLSKWKKEETASKFEPYGKQRCFRKELEPELTLAKSGNQLDVTAKNDDGFMDLTDGINIEAPFDEVDFG